MMRGIHSLAFLLITTAASIGLAEAPLAAGCGDFPFMDGAVTRGSAFSPHVHDADTLQTSMDATPPWGMTVSDAFPLSESDPSLHQVCPRANERRHWSIVGAYGYETYRGTADQGWQNNGIYGSLNLGTRLGRLSEFTGIGFQIGGSLGLYDWKGNPYRPDPERRLQQNFASYGFFRRATQNSPITFAVTHDWMFTDNATNYGLPLDLSQLRFRAGYVTSASNEFGLQGAFRLKDNVRLGVSRGAATGSPPDLVVTTRAVNHVSAYWHHKWSADGANTIITLGFPEDDRVNGEGSLGDFLATATASIPLSDTVGFFGNIMYLNPSGSPGMDAAHDDTWSFTLGIEFFPGRDARSTTIAGERWMPLLPIANNGIFLLDAGWKNR